MKKSYAVTFYEVREYKVIHTVDADSIEEAMNLVAEGEGQEVYNDCIRIVERNDLTAKVD